MVDVAEDRALSLAVSVVFLCCLLRFSLGLSCVSLLSSLFAPYMYVVDVAEDPQPTFLSRSQLCFFVVFFVAPYMYVCG